jgi:hypothetical protein
LSPAIGPPWCRRAALGPRPEVRECGSGSGLTARSPPRLRAPERACKNLGGQARSMPENPSASPGSQYGIQAARSVRRSEAQDEQGGSLPRGRPPSAPVSRVRPVPAVRDLARRSSGCVFSRELVELRARVLNHRNCGSSWRMTPSVRSTIWSESLARRPGACGGSSGPVSSSRSHHAEALAGGDAQMMSEPGAPTGPSEDAAT